MPNVEECPHCLREVTQEDINKMAEREDENKKWEAFKLSQEYKDRQFNQRERRASHLYVSSVLLLILSLTIGTAIVLNSHQEYLKWTTSALATSFFLFVFSTVHLIRTEHKVQKEENILFQQWKQTA